MGKMSTSRIFTGLTAAASDRSGLRITVDAAIEARTKSRRVRLLMAILDPLDK